MCTAYCPCYKTPDTYLKYSKYSDAEYKKFGRTQKIYDSLWGS